MKQTIKEIYSKNGSKEELRKSARMLGKILQKIQENPTEAKFRKMNRVKVEPKLAGAAGAFELLEALGFQNTGDGKLVLPSGNNMGLVSLAIQELAGEQRKLEVALTLNAAPSSASSSASSAPTAEQAEREAILRKVQAENQAKVDELRRKKKRQKKKSQEEFKNARKQKNSEVINASVGKTLKFGRTQAVLPPKKGG